MTTDDTRARIIATAEQLFAAGGEEATSLRAITREAGVNVAAVHYHFGGRDELLLAVLDRKIGPMNARRLDLLDEAAAAYGDPVPVEALLRAFLRPDLELLAELRASGQVQFCRFIGRAYTQPSAVVASFVDRQFRPVGERVFPMLQRAVPEVDPGELQARMRLVVAMVTVLFATADPAGPAIAGLDADVGRSTEIDRQLDRLVAFLSPGLAAPVPESLMMEDKR